MKKRNPRRTTITTQCKLCSDHCNVATPNCQPFIINNSKSFQNWINAYMFSIDDVCYNCKIQSEDKLEVWKKNFMEKPHLLEIEARVKHEVCSLFLPDKDTNVEYYSPTIRFRSHSNAVEKQHISRIISLSKDNTFIRVHTSSETWPLTSFNALYYSKQKIDFTKPHIFSKKTFIDSNLKLEYTRASMMNRLGYVESIEQEARPFWNENFVPVISNNHEEFEQVINPTRVPIIINTCDILYTSPKLDGDKYIAKFNKNGMLLEQFATKIFSLVQIEDASYLNLPHTYMVEKVNINTEQSCYFIFDVNIDIEAKYRILFLQNLEKYYKNHLMKYNIYFQHFFTGYKFITNIEIDYSILKNLKEKLIIPIDGVIITTNKKIQYKEKINWTVDVYIDILQKYISAKECIISVYEDLPQVQDTGIYECFFTETAEIQIIRKRTDRLSPNLLCEIISNIYNSNLFDIKNKKTIKK